MFFMIELQQTMSTIFEMWPFSVDCVLVWLLGITSFYGYDNPFRGFFYLLNILVAPCLRSDKNFSVCLIRFVVISINYICTRMDNRVMHILTFTTHTFCNCFFVIHTWYIQNITGRNTFNKLGSK